MVPPPQPARRRFIFNEPSTQAPGNAASLRMNLRESCKANHKTSSAWPVWPMPETACRGPIELDSVACEQRSSLIATLVGSCVSAPGSRPASVVPSLRQIARGLQELAQNNEFSPSHRESLKPNHRRVGI